MKQDIIVKTNRHIQITIWYFNWVFDGICYLLFVIFNGMSRVLNSDQCWLVWSTDGSLHHQLGYIAKWRHPSMHWQTLVDPSSIKCRRSIAWTRDGWVLHLYWIGLLNQHPVNTISSYYRDHRPGNITTSINGSVWSYCNHRPQTILQYRLMGRVNPLIDWDDWGLHNFIQLIARSIVNNLTTSINGDILRHM